MWLMVNFEQTFRVGEVDDLRSVFEDVNVEDDV